MNLKRYAIVYIVLIIITAHFFTPEVYNWQHNTISDLAAQGAPNQWIMQVGFIGFGIIMTAGLVFRARRAGKIFWADIPLALYSLSVLVTGFFSAAPYLEGVVESLRESQVHSLFASLAGFFLVLGITLAIAVSPEPADKRFHAVFLVLVVGFSALFGQAVSGAIPIGKGLAQRALWAVGFIWLWFCQRGGLANKEIRIKN